MALTKKQQRFADEYLTDFNATQAAIRTGYSVKTANEQGARLLAKVSIKKYIDEQLENIKSEKIAEAHEVMEYLTKVMRGESESSVLCMCGDGCQKVIKKPPDEKERLQAAEKLGKRYGLFKDKVEVDNNVHSEKLSEIFEQIGGKGLEE